MRKFPRIILNSYAAIMNDDQSASRTIIRDFSRMGVGLVVDKEICQGTFISIVYQNEIGEYIQMKSYVKHCRQLKDNTFYVGVQFIGIESRTKTDHAA
ncbi:MAG: PilZ domain-containing protein [Bdellovibrio sp.]|nr:PilZ domain-containing protein [Bdellovibrio sp.]